MFQDLSICEGEGEIYPSREKPPAGWWVRRTRRGCSENGSLLADIKKKRRRSLGAGCQDGDGNPGGQKCGPRRPLPASVSRNGGDEESQHEMGKTKPRDISSERNVQTISFSPNSALAHTSCRSPQTLGDRRRVELLQFQDLQEPLGEAPAHRASATNSWPCRRGPEVGVGFVC